MTPQIFWAVHLAGMATKLALKADLCLCIGAHMQTYAEKGVTGNRRAQRQKATEKEEEEEQT